MQGPEQALPCPRAAGLRHALNGERGRALRGRLPARPQWRGEDLRVQLRGVQCRPGAAVLLQQDHAGAQRCAWPPLRALACASHLQPCRIGLPTAATPHWIGVMGLVGVRLMVHLSVLCMRKVCACMHCTADSLFYRACQQIPTLTLSSVRLHLHGVREALQRQSWGESAPRCVLPDQARRRFMTSASLATTRRPA